MLLAALLPGPGVAAHLVGVAVLALLLVVALAVRGALALGEAGALPAALPRIVLAGALAVVVVDPVVLAVVATLGEAASVGIAAPPIATSLEVLLHGCLPLTACRRWPNLARRRSADDPPMAPGKGCAGTEVTGMGDSYRGQGRT